MIQSAATATSEARSEIGSVAMIGGGQMALALAAGFCRSGLVTAESIRVSDPSAMAVERFVREVPGAVVAPSNAAAVSQAAIMVLAVKPQHAEAACRQVSKAIPADCTVLSVVAGQPLARLSTWLETSRIVRVMPNTACLVGRGAIVMAATAEVTQAAASAAEKLLASVGHVHRVPESLIDAATGLSGSGPGFLAVVVEALADGGVKAGLPRPLALALATETLAGTAAILAATGEHPACLKDRVASPGGTTIAGLAVLESRGLRAALIDAVVAAATRATELGCG